MKKTLPIALILLCLTLFQVVSLMRDKSDVGRVNATPAAAQTVQVLGVYFSPPAGSAQAIVRAIDESRHEILVQAYSFTHNAIAQALARAQARGVSVKVLLDQKSDSGNHYVIGILNQANIEMREDGKHAIAHNKVMVIDDEVVITGSFNFTNSAETRNAENFLILKSADLAHEYNLQWQLHWGHSG